jgi:hypothetical protein
MILHHFLLITPKMSLQAILLFRIFGREDRQFGLDIPDSSLTGFICINGAKIRTQDNLWWFLKFVVGED